MKKNIITLIGIYLALGLGARAAKDIPAIPLKDGVKPTATSSADDKKPIFEPQTIIRDGLTVSGYKGEKVRVENTGKESLRIRLVIQDILPHPGEVTVWMYGLERGGVITTEMQNYHALYIYSETGGLLGFCKIDELDSRPKT